MDPKHSILGFKFVFLNFILYQKSPGALDNISQQYSEKPKDKQIPG